MKIRHKFFPQVICLLLLLLFLTAVPIQSALTLSVNEMRVEKSVALPVEKNLLSPHPVDLQNALSYPPDPSSNIAWSVGTSGVADIQAAFNNARTVENNQLGTSIPMMILPSQTEWNGMNDGEKALWLINRERIDRGIMPLHGLESNVTGVAQYYADYLLDNNTWGHTADGRSPWDRLSDNPAIGACQDFLSIAENLAVFVTSGSSIALPIERSIYMWMYEDCCGSGWGHRHAILWYPYNDNSGSIGREGFLGIGRANGGPYQGPFQQSWPFAEMIVMNVFDPCPAWTYANTNNVQVHVGGAMQGVYSLSPGASLRVAYSALNNGPVRIRRTDGMPLISSERVAYTPDGGATWTSFSELMGLPANQLTTNYLFPWYNNIDLNTQLRFGNVGNAATTVTVRIGGAVQGTYNLTPNQSTRVSYNMNNGPVQIQSSAGVPIIASERVAYHNGSAWTSFSELMGLPGSQLTTTYWFPWYNNIDLDTQLRFGNVGNAATTVTVRIGGVTQGTYNLTPNQSTRVSYGVNNGPVQIQSSGGVPIIVSERVAYHDGSAWTSFSELMGLPANQLTTTYWFPWYNNMDLNSQLRFGAP
jgi:hypothetical protein